jgi:hypothetical protein
MIFLLHIWLKLSDIGIVANGHSYADLYEAIVISWPATPRLVWNQLTRVSSAPFELSTISESKFIVPDSNKRTRVLPPNLK